MGNLLGSKIDYTSLLGSDINGLTIISIDEPILLSNGKYEPMFTLKCRCGGTVTLQRRQFMYKMKKTNCGKCKPVAPDSHEYSVYPGFSNYKIYKNSEIFSLSYTRKGSIFHKERKLKKSQSFGYPTVVLYSDKSEPNTFFVHRLLSELFIPNPSNKPQVNHKNGIRDDLRLENMEWVTASENIKHAYSTGLARTWNKGLKKYENKRCFCGKEFYPLKPIQETCSRSCGSKLSKHRKGCKVKHFTIQQI